jgi:hypothetical protein
MDDVGIVVHFRNDGSVNYRIVIAGPNGADKTTMARRYRPKHAGVTRFVNANLIASGPSPLRPIWPLCSGTEIIPHYLYPHFDDSWHVEIKRPLWTVTTPVNETSSYSVVQHARNDAPL